MKRSHVYFKNPEFITSAVRPASYPKLNRAGKPAFEVAVAGRSNVGKSSLLNDLFGTRNMVKTSSTPGKTQMINFFSVNGGELVFVDLPGYGFAKVPLKMRKNWGPMVQSYLDQRHTLQLILLLFDIRRFPNDDDMQMIEWLVHRQIPTILVLTKVDKVKQCQRNLNTQKILEAFNVENLSYVYYSVKDRIGRQCLTEMILSYE